MTEISMQSNNYKLVITTQGPTYPPSEVMNENGDFVVIGILNCEDMNGNIVQEWGSALVSVDSRLPNFGKNLPYSIIKRFDWQNLKAEDNCILHTLPLPLPCNNYRINFAPEQAPVFTRRCSYPLHAAPIPDLRPEDGRKVTTPIRLSDWLQAQGELQISLTKNKKKAIFDFEFNNLIPNSLYTVMALRKFDLDPLKGPTRPGPLGIPNVFITDDKGKSRYTAIMPNPFSSATNANRIINVVVLWMSRQMSYGGAIGHYGLGGDIHAQLKLPEKSFNEFITHL
jgi:hypothetical protein